MSNTGCEHYQQLLATYRDLGPAEWEALQRHVESCRACARALAVYQFQDRVLGALPKRAPSPALAAGVWARTLDRRKRRSSTVWRWASVTAVAVVVVTMTFGGAATASAEALPGDFLYPVKRAAEQVQYTFMMDPFAREAYLQRLMLTRKEEVRRVQELQREVEIAFEGRLQSMDGTHWNIDGLVVQVPAGMWTGEDRPEAGSVVYVRAKISGEGMTAVQVRVRASEMARRPAEETLPPEPTEEEAPVVQPTNTPQPVDTVPPASPTPEVEEPTEEPTVEASDTPADPPTVPPPTDEPANPDATPTTGGPWRLLTATQPGMGPRWGLTATPRDIVPGLSRTPNAPIVPPGQTRTPPGKMRTPYPPGGPKKFLTPTPEDELPSPTPTAEPTQKPDKPGHISPTPGPGQPDKPGHTSPTPEDAKPDTPGSVSPTPTLGEEPYPLPTETLLSPHVWVVRRAQRLRLEEGVR